MFCVFHNLWCYILVVAQIWDKCTQQFEYCSKHKCIEPFHEISAKEKKFNVYFSNTCKSDSTKTRDLKVHCMQTAETFCSFGIKSSLG